MNDGGARPKLARLSAFAPLAGVTERPHGLLEAPRAAGGDRLLYADVLLGGVHRTALDGESEPETVLAKRRGIGGLVPHRDGGLVVTGRTVLHTEGDRELLDLDGVFGFNDVATDARGRVFAGALRFRPFDGERPVPTEVWRIDGPGSATVAAEGIDWPNGIGLSRDETTLYVSDTANGVVRAFSDGATAAV